MARLAPWENVAAPVAPREALREIAGRLKRLSYLDMITLAEALDLPAKNVLFAADKLENA